MRNYSDPSWLRMVLRLSVSLLLIACWGVSAAHSQSEAEFLRTKPAEALIGDKYIKSLLQDMSPNGAMGRNATHPGDWRIEYQRFGADLITAAIALNRHELVDPAILAFKWGFSRQLPNGSFEHKDAYHSTSMFVEGVSRGLLLLRDSGAKLPTDLLPDLKASLGWLLDPRNMDLYLHKIDKGLPLRYFTVASAIGEAGIVLGDKAAVDQSMRLMQKGLTHLRVDGAISTKKGFDSGYQAVEVIRMIRYLMYVSGDEDDAILMPDIHRAVEWLASRVADDGSLIATGNKRTGTCSEMGRSGNFKNLGFRRYAYALALYGYYTKESSFIDKAIQVKERSHVIGGCK